MSSLLQDIESMLYVSYLVQDIALFNHWENDAAAALTLQPLHDPHFFRKLPKTASQVLGWLEKNMEVLKRQQSFALRAFDPDFDLEGLKALVASSQTSSNEEEATIEFLNDEFGFMGRNSKPVYGITRNPAKKRIVLVFRGSINPKDWEQDAKVQQRQVALTQEELQRYVVNPNLDLLQDFDHVHVHAGFHDYLLETTHDEKETIVEEIMQKVMQLLQDPKNSGYTLYVTGHSLGAALATHAACHFALSNNVPLPVKLITFASPSVGKQDFVKAFNELEKAGRIQHLRITNNDDMVPQGLSLFGYRHTGLHLNLSKETYTMNTTSEDEVGSISISHKWFIGNPTHLLQEHRKRLDHAKANLVAMTFDKLFENPELRTWPANDVSKGDASKEEL